MTKFFKTIYRSLLLISVAVFFSATFFWSCANIGASPQGGPKDTIPPKIVRISPPFNSTNFWPGRIFIEFDEYVQLKDLQKNFFTSPFMNVRPTTMIRGRGIQIDVEADLDSNTTYVLNYGSSVVDNNESNPYVGLKYTFSTGDEVDSLFMTGMVQDAMTADSVPDAFIFFYDARADSVPESDSLLFNARNALAVARTAPNGIFIHANLKPMDYRVYAMLDNNGNQSYDPGVDDVAFMDTIFNPAEMPSFYMWYDTVLLFEVAEPQIFMRTFREEVDTRQNLRGAVRDGQQKVVLNFSSRFPVIEELHFRDIDNSQIIVEYGKETRDSIIYWLAMDKESIPDTLYADLAYRRHDSIGELYSHEQELRLIYVPPFVSAREQREQARAARELTPKQQKRAEKRAVRQARKAAKRQLRLIKKGLYISPPVMSAADSLLLQGIIPADSLLNELTGLEVSENSIVREPSSMKFALASGTINPDDEIKIRFDLPLIRFDTAAVTLLHKDAVKNTEQYVPVNFIHDTIKIREYFINAEWNNGDVYDLMIPEGAIQTIDGEINDTIRRSFTVSEMEKFAALIIDLKNTDPEFEYIIRVYDATGKSVQKEVPHLTEGKHTINYINPGKVVLRIVEDRNRNGKWDTGQLIQRIQPEKVEMYVDPVTGSNQISTRSNFEIEMEIDVEKTFRPRVHISRLIEQTEELVEELIREDNEEVEEEDEELMEDIWEYDMEDQFDSSVPLNIQQ
ncbi:MAG: Ig-like domain-containing protein [Rikenellaceae bacterium]|nr:Ig-like domain-containing protein [Rikenellaceae bacterium]